VAVHCGDARLAEDLVQEALLRACADWRTVRRMQSPAGWVFRVAVNLAASHHRRRSAESRAYRRAAGHPPAADAPSPETAVDLRAALAALPERERQVVVLRYLLDLSTDEAGEAMRISPGAVRSLTHRAVARLRSHNMEAAHVD
jgi:RNA polymerase sigma-70 factor (ECF subfamily)